MTDKIEELIIIGSGPAGYTAAIYSARDKLNPLLFSGDQIGGQLTYTTEVENFPGFSQGVLGFKIMMDMRDQAAKFGTRFIDRNIKKVDFSGKTFEVFDGEKWYRSRSVIIASGGKPQTLGIENEKELMGRGLSVCAVCDAAFYKNKIVYVIGGGDSAIEDAMVLSKFSDNVHIVVRKDKLKASKCMQNKVFSNKKIKVLYNHEIKKIIGQDKLKKLLLINNQNNIEIQVEADGLFYAIGHKPNSDYLNNSVIINEYGYILTSINGLTLYKDIDKKFATMTSVAGVFAAGDVVNYGYKQAVIAAGSGAMAAMDVSRWLSDN